MKRWGLTQLFVSLISFFSLAFVFSGQVFAKCDGWADEGSTHRNAGNGCTYTCTGSGWSGPNSCDGQGNGQYQGDAAKSEAERQRQATEVAKRNAEAAKKVAEQGAAQTAAIAAQTADQRSKEAVRQQAMVETQRQAELKEVQEKGYSAAQISALEKRYQEAAQVVAAAQGTDRGTQIVGSGSQNAAGVAASGYDPNSSLAVGSGNIGGVNAAASVNSAAYPLIYDKPGESCPVISGVPNSVPPGGECCRGGIVECMSGTCGAPGLGYPGKCVEYSSAESTIKIPDQTDKKANVYQQLYEKCYLDIDMAEGTLSRDKGCSSITKIEQDLKKSQDGQAALAKIQQGIQAEKEVYSLTSSVVNSCGYYSKDGAYILPEVCESSIKLEKQVDDFCQQHPDRCQDVKANTQSYMKGLVQAKEETVKNADKVGARTDKYIESEASECEKKSVVSEKQKCYEDMASTVRAMYRPYTAPQSSFCQDLKDSCASLREEQNMKEKELTDAVKKITRWKEVNGLCLECSWNDSDGCNYPTLPSCQDANASVEKGNVCQAGTSGSCYCPSSGRTIPNGSGCPTDEQRAVLPSCGANGVSQSSIANSGACIQAGAIRYQCRSGFSYVEGKCVVNNDESGMIASINEGPYCSNANIQLCGDACIKSRTGGSCPAPAPEMSQELKEFSDKHCPGKVPVKMVNGLLRCPSVSDPASIANNQCNLPSARANAESCGNGLFICSFGPAEFINGSYVCPDSMGRVIQTPIVVGATYKAGESCPKGYVRVINAAGKLSCTPVSYQTNQMAEYVKANCPDAVPSYVDGQFKCPNESVSVNQSCSVHGKKESNKYCCHGKWVTQECSGPVVDNIIATPMSGMAVGGSLEDGSWCGNSVSDHACTWCKDKKRYMKDGRAICGSDSIETGTQGASNCGTTNVFPVRVDYSRPCLRNGETVYVCQDGYSMTGSKCEKSETVIYSQPPSVLFVDGKAATCNADRYGSCVDGKVCTSFLSGGYYWQDGKQAGYIYCTNEALFCSDARKAECGNDCVATKNGGRCPLPSQDAAPKDPPKSNLPALDLGLSDMSYSHIMECPAENVIDAFEAGAGVLMPCMENGVVKFWKMGLSQAGQSCLLGGLSSQSTCPVDSIPWLKVQSEMSLSLPDVDSTCGGDGQVACLRDLQLSCDTGHYKSGVMCRKISVSEVVRQAEGVVNVVNSGLSNFFNWAASANMSSQQEKVASLEEAAQTGDRSIIYANYQKALSELEKACSTVEKRGIAVSSACDEVDAKKDQSFTEWDAAYVWAQPSQYTNASDVAVKGAGLVACVDDICKGQYRCADGWIMGYEESGKRVCAPLAVPSSISTTPVPLPGVSLEESQAQFGEVSREAQAVPSETPERLSCQVGAKAALASLSFSAEKFNCVICGGLNHPACVCDGDRECI